jgi:hypothetical protein
MFLFGVTPVTVLDSAPEQEKAQGQSMQSRIQRQIGCDRVFVFARATGT